MKKTNLLIDRHGEQIFYHEDLERCAKFAEVLDEEKRALIQQHLLSCADCSEQVDGEAEFYCKLEDPLDWEPVGYGRRLAETLAPPTPRRLLPFHRIQKVNGSTVEAPFESVPATSIILARTFAYVSKHPVTFEGAGFGIGVLFFILNISKYNLHPVLNCVTGQNPLRWNGSDTLTIVGKEFQPGLSIRIKGITDNQTFEGQPESISGTSVVLLLPVGTNPDGWTLKVLNADEGRSNFVEFNVVALVPQTPCTIPKRAIAGCPSFDLIIARVAYNSFSIARWNRQDLPTELIVNSGGLVIWLKLNVCASEIPNSGTAQVIVSSPPPGGGTSEPAIFEVPGYKSRYVNEFCSHHRRSLDVRIAKSQDDQRVSKRRFPSRPFCLSAPLVKSKAMRQLPKRHDTYEAIFDSRC